MSSNFTKSAKNASVSIACQIISLLLSFISRSFFIKYLSTEYLGISGLFSNILTLLSFTELGIGHVMIYSLYEPLKKGNNRRIKALLDLFKKTYRVIALTIFLLGSVLTPFIQFLIKGVPDIPENIQVLFLLYLLNTVASYLCTYKKSMLLADQKTYLTNIAASVSQILLIATQTLLLFLFRSFIVYLICQIVFTFLTNVVLTLIVNKQYKFIFDTDADELTKQDKSKLFSNVKALAISKISGIVSSGTDNIIISRMFGLSPVGLVSNYTMIINSVNNVFYNAFTSMSSSIGNFNVNSKVETKRSIFDELFILVYFVYSFVCVCIVVMAQPFITQWLGKDYLLSFPILLHLTLGIYVGGMNYPVFSFRTTMGYFKQVQYVYVACAVSNVLLSILFGYLWGVAGVFAATWLTKFLLTEVADSYFAYGKILERKHINYFIKYFVFLSIAAVNAAICWRVVSVIQIQGWTGIIVKGIACGCTNIIINILIFCHRWEFKSIVSRIKGLARRKANG